MDEFVSRAEYDERQKRIDDENRRQNHRIDKLETITDQIADMAASIKAMVVTMQSMQKEQEEQEAHSDDWRQGWIDYVQGNDEDMTKDEKAQKSDEWKAGARYACLHPTFPVAVPM